MKKIILTASLAFLAVGLFAQSSGSSGMTNKKGEMYLPESGDWAISFDATPFLNYFGGFLSNAGATAPVAKFLNANNTLTGKYYVDEQTAYRGVLRIGMQSTTTDAMISQDITTVPAPFPVPQVTDEMKVSSHLIALGGGMEKRKGKTRLQGYYGGELMFWIAGQDTKYTFGNSFDKTNNPNPHWWNFSSNTLSSGLPRTTENKAGSTFGLSLLGFCGF